MNDYKEQIKVIIADLLSDYSEATITITATGKIQEDRYGCKEKEIEVQINITL